MVKLEKKKIACLHGSYAAEGSKIVVFHVAKNTSGAKVIGQDRIEIPNHGGSAEYAFELGSDHSKGQVTQCDQLLTTVTGSFSSDAFEYVNVDVKDEKEEKTVFNAILDGKWQVYGDTGKDGNLYFECQKTDYLDQIRAFDEHGKEIEFA